MKREPTDRASLASASSWLGAHVSNLLSAAEDRKAELEQRWFGANGSDCQETAVKADSPSNDAHHSASRKSSGVDELSPTVLAENTPAANLRVFDEEPLDAFLEVLSEPACEMEQLLAAFASKVEKRRHEFEKMFPADKATRRIFDQMFSKLRELGKINLRGIETRCALANEMLTPTLSLREPPQYSIQFEQDRCAKEVVYMKRLLSGWCVKIDQTTFQGLAYGDVDVPAKAHENLHMLVVRGPVLRAGHFPPGLRVHVVVACEDASHLSRNVASEERKQVSDERALRFGIPMTSETLEAAALAAIKLPELDIIFRSQGSGDELADQSSDACRCICVDMPIADCTARLLEVASRNLDTMVEAFEFALSTAAYVEKVEYWSSLRSSDATSQKLLVSLFDACLGSSATSRPAGCECARELCEQYQRDYPKLSNDDLAQKLVHWQASLNVSTGFATGFGGFLTMPITIPAGLLATWITSARLAFAIAHVYGHDIFHPCIADAVLWCLTGAAQGDGEESSETTVRSRLQSCKRSRRLEAENVCLELEVRDASPVIDAPDELAGELAGYDPNAKKFADPSSEEFQAEYKTLYDLLGVPQTATQQEIRLAYRRLALRHHPDKLRTSDPEQVRIATQQFQVLGAAYEELGDPERRKVYDRKLHQGDWSWAFFSWETGVDRARQAFMQARSRAAEVLQAKHHDLSGHVASRAMTQAAVDLVEVSSVGAMVRAGGAAELRSSIIAGEKLAANAAAQGSTKLIPILGALISGAIDGATTASVGRCAVRVFKA